MGDLARTPARFSPAFGNSLSFLLQLPQLLPSLAPT